MPRGVGTVLGNGAELEDAETGHRLEVLCLSPLPSWRALSPQVGSIWGVRLNTGRCRLICLGLWLNRKVSQGRTTGRKAWLVVEVCGLRDGPRGWQMPGHWKNWVA